MSAGLISLCGHCGRPITNNAPIVLVSSVPFHLECSRPPTPPAPHGCICPPGAEQTCQGLGCPRRPTFSGA